YLQEITAVCAGLRDAVLAELRQGALPLVLGGDHSMSIGTLAGISSALPPDSRIGVLWVDAHADINLPATSPSGNIHGMPLAVALGHGAQELTSLAGASPALQPD